MKAKDRFFCCTGRAGFLPANWQPHRLGHQHRLKDGFFSLAALAHDLLGFGEAERIGDQLLSVDHPLLEQTE